MPSNAHASLLPDRWPRDPNTTRRFGVRREFQRMDGAGAAFETGADIFIAADSAARLLTRQHCRAFIAHFAFEPAHIRLESRQRLGSVCRSQVSATAESAIDAVFAHRGFERVDGIVKDADLQLRPRKTGRQCSFQKAALEGAWCQAQSKLLHLRCASSSGCPATISLISRDGPQKYRERNT